MEQGMPEQKTAAATYVKPNEGVGGRIYMDAYMPLFDHPGALPNDARSILSDHEYWHIGDYGSLKARGIPPYLYSEFARIFNDPLGGMEFLIGWLEIITFGGQIDNFLQREPLSEFVTQNSVSEYNRLVTKSQTLPDGFRGVKEFIRINHPLRSYP